MEKENPYDVVQALIAKHGIPEPLIEPLPEWLAQWVSENGIEYAKIEWLEKMLRHPDEMMLGEPFEL